MAKKGKIDPIKLGFKNLWGKKSLGHEKIFHKRMVDPQTIRSEKEGSEIFCAKNFCIQTL